MFDVPQNGSVSESLTHTSGHRLVKSPPPPEIKAIEYLYLETKGRHQNSQQNHKKHAVKNASAI